MAKETTSKGFKFDFTKMFVTAVSVSVGLVIFHMVKKYVLPRFNA